MKRPTLLGAARRIPGPIGAIARLPKPALVLVVAVAFGGVIGALVAHAVLAVWIYRDAKAREFSRPDRWALGALVGGVFVYGPYLLVCRLIEGAASDHPAAEFARSVKRNSKRIEEGAREGEKRLDGARETGERSVQTARAALDVLARLSSVARRLAAEQGN